MSNEKIREASRPAVSASEISRRDFFKAGSAIGVAGTLGAGLLVPALGGRAVAAAANPQGDFTMPKGLLPGAQSDSRFPVSFAVPVSQGLRLVIDYFAALNQR